MTQMLCHVGKPQPLNTIFTLEKKRIHLMLRSKLFFCDSPSFHRCEDKYDFFLRKTWRVNKFLRMQIDLFPHEISLSFLLF